MVVGFSSTVSLSDRFLSPVSDGREVTSKAQEVLSFIGWDLFPVALVGRLLLVVMTLVYFATVINGSLLHIRIILLRLLCTLSSSLEVH